MYIYGFINIYFIHYIVQVVRVGNCPDVSGCPLNPKYIYMFLLTFPLTLLYEDQDRRVFIKVFSALHHIGTGFL